MRETIIRIPEDIDVPVSVATTNESGTTLSYLIVKGELGIVQEVREALARRLRNTGKCE